MAARLKGLDDFEFVLRENLCVTVGRVYLFSIVGLTVRKEIAGHRYFRSVTGDNLAIALILTVALYRGDPLLETLLFALILTVAATAF